MKALSVGCLRHRIFHQSLQDPLPCGGVAGLDRFMRTPPSNRLTAGSVTIEVGEDPSEEYGFHPRSGIPLRTCPGLRAALTCGRQRRHCWNHPSLGAPSAVPCSTGRSGNCLLRFSGLSQLCDSRRTGHCPSPTALGLHWNHHGMRGQTRSPAPKKAAICLQRLHLRG